MPGAGLLLASVQSPQALTVSHVMGILKINFFKKVTEDSNYEKGLTSVDTWALLV